MDVFITALETHVTADAFWGSIAAVAGIIGVLILVSFGYGVLRKVVNGAGKGKAKF